MAVTVDKSILKLRQLECRLFTAQDAVEKLEAVLPYLEEGSRDVSQSLMDAKAEVIRCNEAITHLESRYTHLWPGSDTRP